MSRPLGSKDLVEWRAAQIGGDLVLVKWMLAKVVKHEPDNQREMALFCLSLKGVRGSQAREVNGWVTNQERSQ